MHLSRRRWSRDPCRVAPLRLITVVSVGSVLAVNYYTPDHARLAVYRIEAGRLIGQWILVGGDGAAHAETLTRIAGALATAHVPSPPPVSVKRAARAVPTVFGRGI